MLASARIPRIVTPRPRLAAALLIAVSLLAAPADAAGPGAWTNSYNLDKIAIHMALIQGENDAYHSRIVFWQGKTEGGVLGWQPLSNENCGTYLADCLSPITGWQEPAEDPFCSGQIQLASGQLLTVGGSDPYQWGLAANQLYVPGANGGFGSWQSRQSMGYRRWYPTGTTLSDGRVLVSSGHQYHHLWLYGGRRNGASAPPAVSDPEGYKVGRMGRRVGAQWDLSEPTFGVGGLRPVPREGHTLVYLRSDADTAFGRGEMLFGGRGSSGSPVTDVSQLWWLRRELGTTEPYAELDSDHRYRWVNRTTTGTAPEPRTEHIAAAISETDMVVFGGARATDLVPAGLLFRHLRRISQDVWNWQPVTVTSGSAPTPRYGHAAVYVEDAGTRKLYLFGGSGALGAAPTDATVYVFTFSHAAGDPASGAWSTLTLSGGPEPRRDHAMVYRTTDKQILLFGGHVGGAPASDTVWRLKDLSTTPSWASVANPGSVPWPRPRAGHSAAYDLTTHRMLVFGGDPTIGGDPLDQTPWAFTDANVWEAGQAAPFHLSQHAASADPTTIGSSTEGAVFARVSEVYNPTDDTWTPHPAAHWNQGWYPLHFVVPGGPTPGGGRVVAVGQQKESRALDIPLAPATAAPWQSVTPNGVAAFAPVTGVTYAPGKILIAGGSGTNTGATNPQFGLIGATQTLDVAAGNGWQNSAWMFRRDFHNLVILPDGKVLALGGMSSGSNGSSAIRDSAVRCPQIWDPATRAWTFAGDLPGGGGTACQPCDLACDPDVRNYHSVAMLLPDGRILTAGGWPKDDTPPPHGNPNRKTARVYCPPYLFGANGTTPIDPTDRPAILSSPAAITYGEGFAIGKRFTDQIASVCLMRPAAVTHEFDQNQRRVPLDFEVSPGGTELRAIAPSSGGAAPPGNYLLFIVNQSGVPAIARWVKLGQCPTIPCDTDSPPQTTGLSPDIAGPNEVWLVWNSPGDETNPLSGGYDLRFSTAAIASDDAYAAATPASNEPGVAPADTPLECTVDSLSACTQYHFALKTRDGVGPSFKNWSLRSNTVTVTTTCGGGAGGGYSAHRVDGGREGGGSLASAAVPPAEAAIGAGVVGLSQGGRPLAGLASASTLGTGTGVLEAETRRTPEGGWQVTLRLVSQAVGVDAADAGAIVSQVRDDARAWRTLGRFRPGPGQSPLGLCALRDQGRVVFPAGYGLDQVVTRMRSGGQDFAMKLAYHSRLGAMGNVLLENGGGVELALGDALTLTYDATGSSPADETAWYLLVRPNAVVAPDAASARREATAAVPARFALHPNQPNPFRRSTTIAFDLPLPTPIRLEVFDLLGRRVAILAQGEYPAGAHAVEWDLRDHDGSTVRPGVYVYRITAGEFRARRKMSVVP